MDSSWLSLSLSSHTPMEEVPDQPASWSSAELSSSPPKLVDFLGGANGGGQAPSTSHSHQQGGQEEAAISRDTIAAALQHQQQLKIAMAAAASAQEHFMFNGPSLRQFIIGRKTSRYRGVSWNWKGKFEASIWDKSSKKDGSRRNGTQVHLGRYDTEDMAARAYDLAALKFRGLDTHINFSVENYRDELEQMKSMTRQEVVEDLRMRSRFSQGSSIDRQFSRHHGRWSSQISCSGSERNSPDVGIFNTDTQGAAAEACDIAAIKVLESSTLMPEEDPHKVPMRPRWRQVPQMQLNAVSLTFSSHRQ